MNRIKSKEKENKIPKQKVARETSLKKVSSRIDGRSATRTGRIVQFATSVTVDFDNTIRQLAKDDDIMMVEVLEKAILLYKEQRERAKSAQKAKK